MSVPADGAREAAAAALLVRLPGATRQRLSRLLARWAPTAVIEAFVEDDPELLEVLDGCRGIADLRRSWRERCSGADLAAEHRRLVAARTGVWWQGQERWAALFADDLEAPAVLFTRGDLAALDQPRVAIVGTRRATSAGREMAKLLGRKLSEAGVGVVSGLALGVDTAGHFGALQSERGRPIGVVGSGLDVVYPRQNAALWEKVGASGLLLSESPPGRAPIPGAFPERNRIIAQLSTVVIVVESHATGGSLITVDRAFDRGRRVMVVPGSPLSPASVGSNELLRGARPGQSVLPCLSVDDVLAVLDLDRASSSEFFDPRPEPSPRQTAVLAAMGWETWLLGRLVLRTGFAVQDVTLALAELEADGWVGRSAGQWHRLAMRPW